MADGERQIGHPWGSSHVTVDGDGPLVVLVHGWSYSVHTWDAVVPGLAAAGFRVAAYDVRGHGATRFAGTDLAMDDLVDDLDGVLDGLGADRALLAGHSMGGMIALAYALRRPERVAGLALIDTGAAARPADVTIEAMLAEHLATGPDPGYWWPVLEPMLYSARHREERPEAVAAARDRFLASDLRALHVAFRALATREDLTARLGEVSVPTAVVAGEADAIFAVDDQASMAAAIPGAEFAVLPGAGHLTTEEAGPAVAERLVALARRAGHAPVPADSPA